jgi:hypothetical protein
VLGLLPVCEDEKRHNWQRKPPPGFICIEYSYVGDQKFRDGGPLHVAAGTCDVTIQNTIVVSQSFQLSVQPKQIHTGWHCEIFRLEQNHIAKEVLEYPSR